MIQMHQHLLIQEITFTEPQINQGGGGGGITELKDETFGVKN